MLAEKILTQPINICLLIMIGLFFFLTMSCQAFNYESAYDKTAVGQVEIKTIPASKTLVTKGSGKYFERDNQLFMRLFDYIKRNDVAMTIPVEASVNKAGMVFYVGQRDGEKNLENEGNVKVVKTASRLVASVGIRGSYTEKNFAEGEARLKDWLDAQDQYKAAGDAYAVYWNGPFIPGFMKRSEVHIPLETAVTMDESKTQGGSEDEAPPLVAKEENDDQPEASLSGEEK